MRRRSVSFHGGTSFSFDDDYSSTSAVMTFQSTFRVDVKFPSRGSNLGRASGIRLENTSSPLRLPLQAFVIPSSVKVETSSPPPPGSMTRLTSQISRISFECYRTASILFDWRTFANERRVVEFVAAEMRMREVSLRVIGSFASFATVRRGNGIRLRGRGKSKVKNSKTMDEVRICVCADNRVMDD